jgi:hypothetical protein
VESSVSRTEADALAELVLRGGPVEVESMAAFRGLRNPVVALQRARRQVDVGGGSTWRAIMALPSDKEGRHIYVFDPDGSVRFVVVVEAIDGWGKG